MVTEKARACCIIVVSISPFRGLCPNPDYLQEIVSPPYDAVRRQQGRHLVQEKPYSFLRVVRSDLEFPDDVNPYADEIYQRARQNLHAMIEKQLLILEKKEAYYIYRLNFSLNSQHCQQTGLVALFSVDDYLQNRIKKHEMTRPQKEKDRTTHIRCLQAHTGLVYLLYRDQREQELTELLDQYADTSDPMYDLKFENVRHRLYRVDSMELTKQLTSAFSALPCVYIADGHHRATSAVTVASELRCDSQATVTKPHNQSNFATNKQTYFLAAAFPAHQAQILPYNRVVRGLNGLTETELLSAIRQSNIRIEAIPRAHTQLKHCQANMCIGHSWYELQWDLPPASSENLQNSLAVSVLQERVLKPVLGIDNPRSSNRLTFVGGHFGMDELQNLMEKGDFDLAFSLPAVEMEQLLTVADQNQIMPPKSTWFEPKLVSGLIVHLLSPE